MDKPSMAKPLSDEVVAILMQSLGVRRDQLSSAMHQPKHVLGDGNCTWRALWAAMAVAGCDVPLHWRVLKKKLMKAYNVIGEKQLVQGFGTYAAHVGMVAYLAAVALYECVVEVHTEHSTMCLRTEEADDTVPVVTLMVSWGHCQPTGSVSMSRARIALRTQKKSQEQTQLREKRQCKNCQEQAQLQVRSLAKKNDQELRPPFLPPSCGLQEACDRYLCAGGPTIAESSEET
eukprot:1547591-Amphidinium_carterae.5